MGIFTRFKDIITSNISSMLDQAEDPDKLIRLMLREMEETLVELKSGCAATMADAQKTRKDLESAEADAAMWERRAELAVQAGRDDMAREAVNERLLADERVRVLQGELSGFDDLIQKCREDIRALEERITSTRDRQRLMNERHVQAGHRRKAREQIRAADSMDAMQRFADLEQRINRMEHEADLAYTAPEKHQDFKTLERDAAVSAALDDIKSRLGKHDGERV